MCQQDACSRTAHKKAILTHREVFHLELFFSLLQNEGVSSIIHSLKKGAEYLSRGSWGSWAPGAQRGFTQDLPKTVTQRQGKPANGQPRNQTGTQTGNVFGSQDPVNVLSKLSYLCSTFRFQGICDLLNILYWNFSKMLQSLETNCNVL